MNSRENSIKKALINDITTNKKALVDCEINSWLETNQKQKKVRQILQRPVSLIRRKNYSVAESIGDLNKVIEVLDKSTVDKSETFNPQKITQADTQQNLKEDPKVNIQNLLNQKRRNSVLELKEVSFNTLDHQNLKPRSRCNSKGYVLKQMRRKLKQKNQLRHYSYNKLSQRNTNLENINLQDSIAFVQKRYRIIPVGLSRNGNRKAVL